MPPLDLAEDTNNDQNELVDDPLPTSSGAESGPSGTQNHLEAEGENTHYESWFGNLESQGIIWDHGVRLFSIYLMILILAMLSLTLIVILMASKLWTWVWSLRWMDTMNSTLTYAPRYMGMPLIDTLVGMVLWFPVLFASLFDHFKVFHKVCWYSCAVAAFGLIAWGYCALVSNTNTTYALAMEHSSAAREMHGMYLGIYLLGWRTGTMPECPQICAGRVAKAQQALFTTEVYETQFARTRYILENYTWHDGASAHTWQMYPTFDFEPFRSIQSNLTLCDQGFLGNTDLYGLGVRSGVYMHWISSIFANHFLSTTRQDVQRVYLMFSLAICLATLIASSMKSCVFSIEIEVLYWMYWGGFMCVFGSAPCQIRLGSSRMWTKLDWTTAILFTTHWIMTFHGFWYIRYGYDQIFARMPCGTYHFFVAPVLDPSERYWVLRDWLTMLVDPIIIWALFTFPLVSLLLLPEVKHAIQNSVTYEGFFRRTTAPNIESEPTPALDPSDNSPSWLPRIYFALKRVHIGLRKAYSLPGHRRGGIRLITPVDVESRKLLRIRWAATGLASCFLAILAIELTLKWNKVRGIYSVETTGQYVPLIIGISSLISVWWNLLRQEGERRRRLRCDQAFGEAGEEYELQSITSAISHAFAQPDIEFLSSDGALSEALEDANQEIADERTSSTSPF